MQRQTDLGDRKRSGCLQWGDGERAPRKEARMLPWR